MTPFLIPKTTRRVPLLTPKPLFLTPKTRFLFPKFKTVQKLPFLNSKLPKKSPITLKITQIYPKSLFLTSNPLKSAQKSLFHTKTAQIRQTPSISNLRARSRSALFSKMNTVYDTAENVGCCAQTAVRVCLRSLGERLACYVVNSGF
jgi:hypothetical protein